MIMFLMIAVFAFLIGVAFFSAEESKYVKYGLFAISIFALMLFLHYYIIGQDIRALYGDASGIKYRHYTGNATYVDYDYLGYTDPKVGEYIALQNAEIGVWAAVSPAIYGVIMFMGLGLGYIALKRVKLL